jgi:hypothetical protein
VQQPKDQAVAAGTNVIFSVQVAGTPPFSRQWFFNGLPVQGATNLALLLTNVQSSQVGDYSIIVSNAGGPVASAPAHLL